ncbi:hypothetical protein G7046_g3510 [Stylonectria norvegica]|nr:hypothetical protein G7046_g3510 [Stylonectria norvegica]
MMQDVSGSGSQLIRIAGDGNAELLPTRIEGNKNIIMGDIDNNGHLWISDTGRPWWQIDVMPGSSTLYKVINSGTATHSDYIADWAFVPGGGDYMYAVQYTQYTSTMVRFSRSTYTWTTLNAFGNLSGYNVWGALYAASDGNMYGSENIGGNIYKFPVAPTIGKPVFISAGPKSSQNDGARCIDSQDVVLQRRMIDPFTNLAKVDFVVDPEAP